jgi:hypothetical protein
VEALKLPDRAFYVPAVNAFSLAEMA